MAQRWHMICAWVCLFQILKVSAFNLDTENVLQRSAEPGTLFGFSIAFHQQLSPVKRNLLLVGAPRGKHRGQVNITGVVYQCDLTTESEQCQPIQFNSKEFLNSRYIDGQWMGVRVTSQGPGQNVMTCAHRYQQWSPSPSDKVPHLLTGQCYLLGDQLRAGEEEERRWRRVVCDSEHLTRRRKDHAWFIYCQQGHGAAFAKDNRTLLFGAPGAYQWKGIVRQELLDDLDLFAKDPRETGNMDLFDPKLIPLHSSSYLGFSLDSGMALMEQGELTIVSGAPRGGFSGQVTFLRADPSAPRSLSVELILSGPGLASSFGYDVAVVDLNNDGWEDLAVGAPQFYLKEGLVGGAVYIYINNKGRKWDQVVPKQLLGKKESLFGLAVENIGDINQDGFTDIAVGAPYDGSGRVYIYCGSSNGINEKAAQVLSPGPTNTRLFGYSLSGNLDVDDNHYPDVAVGSLSDSVFIYRARPVVSVRSALQVTPQEIDVTEERCDKVTCQFTAQVCFTYTARPASFNPKLKLNFTIEGDAERRRAKLPPRVSFQRSSQGKVDLPRQGQEICTDAKFKLLREIKDRLHSIPISVSVALLSSGTDTRTTSPLPEVTPVLNLYQQSSDVSQIRFINKGCGSDNVCQSNLELRYKFCSRKTLNHRDVFTSLARDDGVAVITPSDEEVALEITVTNRGGDDAHQSRSIILLPETLRYSSVINSTATETEVSCTANDNGTIIDCELGNPLQRDAEVTFYVMLTTSSISLSIQEVNVTLQLLTTSVQSLAPVEAVAKVVFELKLQVFGVAKPSQVPLSEDTEGERAIKTMDDIGARVQFQFRITNVGRPLKSFANASLNIRWPKETTGGKPLLYLSHVSSEGVQSAPCSPAQEMNPLKHQKGWNQPQRKRRGAEHEGEHEALSSALFPFLPHTRKFKTLTCSDALRCVEIRCPLLGLDSNAVLSLHSRLWNSTLTEDYSSFHYLVINVDATISLTNSPENIGLTQENPGTQVKVTVFLEKKIEFITKVAWWIILLTVVALLLLVAVCAYLMWKNECINRLRHKKKPS